MRLISVGDGEIPIGHDCQAQKEVVDEKGASSSIRTGILLAVIMGDRSV